jgi:hypothetical protein
MTVLYEREIFHAYGLPDQPRNDAGAGSAAGMLLGQLVMGVLADAIHLTTPFAFAALLVFVLGWLCHREAVARPGSRAFT